MARILIPYGTSEGQTATISEYVAARIRDRGDEACAVDLTDPRDPEPAL